MVSCAFTRFGSAKIVNGGRKAKQKIIIFLSDLATFMHRVEAEHIHQDKFRGACAHAPRNALPSQQRDYCCDYLTITLRARTEPSE